MWTVARPCALAAALFFAIGCQSILGFEEFEGGGGGAAASGAEGSACAVTGDCRASMVCVFGRCRTPCRDETECASGSVCLFSGVQGGCRVAKEAACASDGCENAQLVCGLDGTCRVDCGPVNSCDSPTQRCVAGACVSTIGDEAALFDCGGAAEGDVSCAGATLQACNVLAPGNVALDECASAGVCLQSIPEDGYDAAEPPVCSSGCAAGQAYCAGASLLECAEDGTGPVGAGAECATSALCQRALEQGASTCPEPACEAGATRCAGGQTELVGETCNEGRTGFEEQDLCHGSDLQCNPATGRCLALDVDATEVTFEQYASYLATNPTGAEQPPGCAWNDALEPDAACLAQAACSGPDCPVVCVDWCDALAYCEWNGQHLCGKIGGGMVPFDQFADPGISEWSNACSSGGQFLYAHGDTPDSTADDCPYAGNSGETAYDVGTRSRCQSPAPGYAHLTDMSGNVAEWENACEIAATVEAAGATDACRTRGGSYTSPLELLQCGRAPTVPLRRDAVSPDVGFRCCG